MLYYIADNQLQRKQQEKYPQQIVSYLPDCQASFAKPMDPSCQLWLVSACAFIPSTFPRQNLSSICSFAYSNWTPSQEGVIYIKDATMAIFLAFQPSQQQLHSNEKSAHMTFQHHCRSNESVTVSDTESEKQDRCLKAEQSFALTRYASAKAY